MHMKGRLEGPASKLVRIRPPRKWASLCTRRSRKAPLHGRRSTGSDERTFYFSPTVLMVANALISLDRRTF